MSKDKLIPEIRFPEFKNEGEWDIEKLGVISEIVRGGSPRPIEDYFTTDVNGLNWLKIADVHSDAKYITQTKEKVKKEALSSTREVNSGDLILSNSMSFGRPYILKITTCIHDGWIAIRKISNKTFEGYLYYFISSESSQSYFQTNAAGAAVKNLNAEIIKLLPIYLPKNIKEQQKIASCLSSLDEVIAAHSQKLALLKDHKKGLMQNLFPQEGEKVPKYRFKEFENDGEWELKPFSKYIKLYRGSSPRPIIEYQTQGVDGVNWIKIGDTGSVTDFVIRSVSEKITPKGAEKSRAVRRGELILANSMSYGSTYLLDIEGCIYDGWFVLREYDEVFDKQFLLQLLNSEFMQNQYKKLAAGGIVQNISSEIVYSTLLPKTSKAEQQKIASCLSSLDALITAQVQKIEQLKLHKKGLMQGLFPKIRE